MKKYKPITIHHLYYGYGYWWGSYFFFIGKHSTAFAIVPMCREHQYAIYANNGNIIDNGDTLSWSKSRQKELQILGGLIMELKDYSTEELKAELKRRSDLAKVEKAKVKNAECASTGAR